MSVDPQLSVVSTDALPEYPISSRERLDSHWFMQWNLKRWRGSTFRKLVEPDVGWAGFNLFCIAQDGTPVGTLPCADRELAVDLGLPLERWQGLMKRDITPLHGWQRYHCDNGEVRLGHAVVIEVVLEALRGRDRNVAKNADDRMRKRLQTIAQATVAITGGSRLAQDDERLNAISDWIATAYPGGSATVKRVREAMNALSR